MADLAVKNGYMMIGEGRAPIQKGTILVENGKILEVMLDGENPRIEESRVIDATDKLVILGLVNTHTHLAGCVFRGLLDDWDYPPKSLYALGFPMELMLDKEDYYWLNLLGAIETLKAGFTTISDMYHHSDMTAEAVSQVGMRAVIARKVFECNIPSVGDGDYTRYPQIRRKRLKSNIDLIKRWHQAEGGRITCRVGAHATDTCSKELLIGLREMADDYGIGLHIHVAQSPSEVAYVQGTHGRSPIEYLSHLGFLKPDAKVVYLTEASGADLDILKREDAAFAHCPARYGRNGKYPPVKQAYLDRGIPTVFGTEWLRMDMWDGMRQTVSNLALTSGQKNLFSARDLLYLSTQGFAELLGLSESLGALKAGFEADIILIDLWKPKLQPFYPNVQSVVFYVDGGDIDGVIVAGKEVIKDGRCVGIDENRVIQDVHSRVPRFLAMLEETYPQHRAFYEV